MTAAFVPNCSFLFPFLFMFYVDWSLETPASKWYSCLQLHGVTSHIMSHD